MLGMPMTHLVVCGSRRQHPASGTRRLLFGCGQIRSMALLGHKPAALPTCGTWHQSGWREWVADRHGSVGHIARVDAALAAQPISALPAHLLVPVGHKRRHS
jgi:hypothetical protein